MCIRDREVLEDVYLATHSNRHKIPAPGINGGNPGGLSRLVLNYDKQTSKELPRETANYELKKGDVVTVFAGGGGGYGNPLDRSSDAVLQDVWDGKISLLRAAEIYGVAIDPEDLTIQVDATDAMRQGRRTD